MPPKHRPKYRPLNNQQPAPNGNFLHRHGRQANTSTFLDTDKSNLIHWFNAAKRGNEEFSLSDVVSAAEENLGMISSDFSLKEINIAFGCIAGKIKSMPKDMPSSEHPQLSQKCSMLVNSLSKRLVVLLNGLTLCDENDARTVANFLCNLAKLTSWPCLPPELQPVLLEAIQSHADGFDAQNTANTIWGLASLGASAELLAALQVVLLAAIQRNANQFNAQGIANTLLALAKLGILWDGLTPELQIALLAAIQRNVHEFNAQDIANTLWALAKLGILWDGLTPELQTALLEAIQRNANRFNEQGIANTLWALAKLGASSGGLAAELRAALWDSLPSGDSTPSELQVVLLEAIQRNANRFNEQNIANTLWALANLEIPWDSLTPELQTALLEAIQRNANRFNTQGTANIVLALMILHSHCRNEESLAALKQQATCLLREIPGEIIASFDPVEARQYIWAWHYFSCFKHFTSLAFCPLRMRLTESPRSSNFHKEILGELEQALLGEKSLVLHKEYAICERSIFIDIAITRNGKPVFFIEVDGHGHRSLNDAAKEIIIQNTHPGCIIKRISYQSREADLKDVIETAIEVAKSSGDVSTTWSVSHNIRQSAFFSCGTSTSASQQLVPAAKRSGPVFGVHYKPPPNRQHLTSQTLKLH